MRMVIECFRDKASPVGPEKHGGLGYFWHYHAHNHKSGHIFFL